MGDTIYSYGEKRFGVSMRRDGKKLPTPVKSRWQQEIKRLIRERRQTKKVMEKSFWCRKRRNHLTPSGHKEPTGNLAKKAENLRKLRKKTENTRTRHTWMTWQHWPLLQYAPSGYLESCRRKIEWARMKIQPNKPRSISIVKWMLKDTRFCISDELTTTVSEQPVKSLGRWYNASLKDKEQVQQLRKEIHNGLENINQILLPNIGL